MKILDYVVLPMLITLSSSVFQTASGDASKKIAVIMASHGDIDDLSELKGYALTSVMKNDGLLVPDFLRPIIGNVGYPLIKNTLVTQYSSFGVQTHYRENAAAQADALTRELRAQGLNATAFYGFNFLEPFIEDVVEGIKNDGYTDLVVLNNGAQFSLATGGENFEDATTGLERAAPIKIKAVGVKEWSERKDFRDLMEEVLRRDAEAAFPDVPKDQVCIGLGSHGLPLGLINKGDPATKQMVRVVEDLRARMPEYRLYHGYLNDDFFPGAEWIKPAFAETADTMAADGCRNVVLDGRLSFTVHHRATLYELDVKARRQIESLNQGAKIVFAQNFNADPLLAKLLTKVVRETVEGTMSEENLVHLQ